MADGNINEITIAGRDEGECSDTTVEIKIKTLDSQTYTLRVNKCMPVPALKDQIATVTGVLSEQQRLICRGKVLKDDQLLSAYHVEDGHTLHLVVRQPLQTPPTSMEGTGGGDGNIELQGADSTSGATRSRNGQVSHSVVLGTLNIADQGDGGMPDLNRIISAVLSSVGIGNLVPVNSGSSNGATLMAPAFPTRGQQGSDLEGQERTGNASVRSHINELQPDQAVSDVQFEPFHGAFRFPAAQLLRSSTQTTVIPDSLTTLSQYLDRMSQEFSLNSFNNQPQSTASQSNEAEEYRNSSGLPSVSRGLPSPAALGAIIRRTQELLTHHVGASLSQLAGQLEGEASVTDATMRSGIQSAAWQNGIIMQNLGALLLELGRTTMTLRMGQSSPESVVNAGPAVYVSTSGPNPMMVQPLPFQPGSSFSAAPVGAARPSAGVTVGTIGAGDVPRSIDIHIRAGTSLAPGANTGQGEPVSGQQGVGQANQIGNVLGGNLGRQGVSSFVGETGAVRVVPVRTVVAAVPATINTRPPTEAAGGALGVFYPLLARFQQLNPSQLTQMRSLPLTLVGGGHSGGTDTTQHQLPTSVPLSTIQAQVQVQASGPTNDQNASRHEEIQPGNFPSLSASTSAAENQSSVCETMQSQAGSSVEQDLAQHRPSNVHIYSIDVGTGNLQRNIDLPNSGITGGENGSLTELSNGLGQIFNGMVSGGQVGSGRADVGDFMSQFLHNSPINRHSMPFAEQMDTVPAAGLSNIMGQVLQNSFSRSGHLQMEQQMGEGRDLREQIGNRSQYLRATFSGLNRSQGGIDISGLLQQMIPVVSQARGGESEGSPSGHGAEVQTRISNDEQALAEETEAEMPKPQDEADNGNASFSSDSERQQSRHSDDSEIVNISSDAERQQSQHADDIYPDDSPVSKRQKTQ